MSEGRKDGPRDGSARATLAAVASTAFFGREAECERLLQLVRAGPLVTVTGPGGIGKTRLVVEATATMAAEQSMRVVVAELASLPAGCGLDAVSAQAGWATPEAAAMNLAQAPSVLVLDNCEHVLDEAALFVARLLRVDESLRIVATSREPLGVQGEHVFVLAPLALPKGDVDVESSAAVQLFLDRAGAAGAAWDRSASTMSDVGALCRQLDGLPLAIELAAARARALAPRDLLALMARRLDVLQRPGRAGAGDPERHRSLRAAIEVSTALLDDEERTFLQRLGVFTGPFDLDLARMVAAGDGGAADPLHVVDLLGRLVDRSLVVAEHDGATTRYRLLETLRDHAIEGLVRSGEDERVAQRFVDAMVAEADAIVTEGLRQWSGDLLGRITARFHDLLAAITWCCDHDDRPDRAYRLVLPLFAAVHQSRSSEVLAAGRRVIDRWRDEPAPWRAEALAVLSTAAVIAGQRDAAQALGQWSLDDDAATDVARLVAHRALGLAARAGDDLPAACEHFTAGKAAAAAVGAASFERELAGFEASMRDQLGEADAATNLIGWVVERSLGAADHLTEAWARLVRATMAMSADDWDAARDDCRAARAAIDRRPHPGWGGATLRLEAMIVANDAALVGLEHGWAASTAAWRRALDAAAAHGSAGELKLTLRAAAAMAGRLGHDDVARALLDAAPASTELSVLSEPFTAELRRLEPGAERRDPPRDIATVLRRARDALAMDPAAAAATVPAAAATSPSPGRGAIGALRREGELWNVEYADRGVVVRHLKGIADLAVLVAQPGTEVHCVQLMGGADVGGSVGPALDEQAKRAYQNRIRELQADIDAARDDADIERAAKAELELDALVEQLSEAFGLGGRARSRGASTERARAAVTYRIRAAVKRLGDAHPELGRHLDNAVRTGTWCSYRPETDVVWEVASSAQPAKR